MEYIAVIVGLVCSWFLWLVLRPTRNWSFRGRDGTTLLFRVPRRWAGKVEPTGPICFQEKLSRTVLRITMFPREATHGMASCLRELVESARDDALKTSLEEKIAVHTLGIGTVRGFYFSSTDADAKPESYRFKTTGLLERNSRVFSFTVLSRTDAPGGTAGAMEILSRMRVVSASGTTKPDPEVKHGRPPSRVASARAGWVFTGYWQILCSGDQESPTLSFAERSGIASELRAVFVNPACGLDDVVGVYRRGAGSNEILKKAMQGLPDYVLRWFRIGQTLNCHIVASNQVDDKSFEVSAIAARGNLAAGGVSQNDIENMLGLVRSLREVPGTEAGSTTGLELIQEISNCLQSIAARHDRYEEFERRAIDHGGVFVSYSHADRDLVEKITSRFDSDQIHYWLDDREMLAGHIIDQKISRGIRDSCLFLVLLTPTSTASEWVNFEIQEATREESRGAKVIFPVLAKGLVPSAVPKALETTLSIDLDRDFDAGYEKLRVAILAHLAEFAAAGPRD